MFGLKVGLDNSEMVLLIFWNSGVWWSMVCWMDLRKTMAGDDVLWILSQNQNADLFLSAGIYAGLSAEGTLRKQSL